MVWNLSAYFSFIIAACFTYLLLVRDADAFGWDEYACTEGNGLAFPRSSDRCKLIVYDSNINNNANTNSINWEAKILNEVEYLNHNNDFGSNDDIGTVLLWGAKLSGNIL